MGKRVIWIVILLLILGGAYVLYKHRQDTVASVNGDVTGTGLMTPEEKARFDRENSGDTADGQSERKLRTARGDAAAGSVASSGSNNASTAVEPIPGAPAGVDGTPAGPGTQTTATQAAGGQSPSMAVGYGAGAPPTSDTIAPNPPNGMAFTGKGTYQWYRQGNLTWRVDTVTGRSCIVFATMDEWRKSIVLSHGCGRDA